MRAKLASTVFGLMNTSAPISRLVMPDAASSATRSSEAVSNVVWAALTAVRASSLRVRSAHNAVFIPSNAASDCVNVVVVDSFWRCRR